MRISRILIALCLIGCTQHFEPFTAVSADRVVADSSAYPLATTPAAVGQYPGRAKSGGGYFYDEVLEYRVWIHPERGGEDIAAGEDYFAAFAMFERASAFAARTPGAESPLVLVRQREWINEPDSGHFVAERGDRVTEWQVEWLTGAKRDSSSVRDFLARPRPARRNTR
jgi:hypothetical protein